MSCDPSQPTRYHPGSSGKLRVLRARARANVPLFVAGDAQGLRRLNDISPSGASRRTLLELAILASASYQPASARELAARTGARWTSGFRRALEGLREAGVLEYRQRSGWRLALVAEI